jgi:hypothetical protein
VEPTCRPRHVFALGPTCQAPSSTWSACSTQRATRRKPPQLPLRVRCPKHRSPLHSPRSLPNAEPPRRVSLGESDEHRCTIFFSRRHTTSLSAPPSPPITTAVAPSLFCHARLSSTTPAAIPPTYGRSYSPHRAGKLHRHTSTRRPSGSKLPAMTVDRHCRVSTPATPPSRCRVHLPHQRRTLTAPPSCPSAATVFFLDTEHLLRPSRPTRSSTRRGMPAPELHH